MPFYTIHHLTPLTLTQKDALAAAITKIHSEQFSVLRNFIHLRFLPVPEDSYIGGLRRSENHIIANVRAGPARTQSDWDSLCLAIKAAWDEIVVDDPVPRAKGAGGDEGERALNAMFLVGSAVGGMELGVLTPRAGEDRAWLERRWGEFVERAEKGQGLWAESVREARERGLVDEGRAGKVSRVLVSLWFGLPELLSVIG